MATKIKLVKGESPYVALMRNLLGQPKAVETKVACDPRSSMTKCKNPDCSWFNHSQVGLDGGDYPEGYRHDN